MLSFLKLCEPPRCLFNLLIWPNFFLFLTCGSFNQSLLAACLYQKLEGEIGCFHWNKKSFFSFNILLKAKIQIWNEYCLRTLNVCKGQTQKRLAQVSRGIKSECWDHRNVVVFSLSNSWERQWPKATKRGESLKLWTQSLLIFRPI